MQRTVITNVCDLCGAEENDLADLVEVQTHLLMVDGHGPVELEACGRCWPEDTLGKLTAAGRLAGKKQKRHKQPVHSQEQLERRVARARTGA